MTIAQNICGSDFFIFKQTPPGLVFFLSSYIQKRFYMFVQVISDFNGKY